MNVKHAYAISKDGRTALRFKDRDSRDKFISRYDKYVRASRDWYRKIEIRANSRFFTGYHVRDVEIVLI